MNKLFINEDEIMSQQAREVFRSFRSNIEFTGVDNRAIVITSCLPADGKSTVSLRLAMTFAESEKKTVLVDADMRRSVLMRRVRAEGDNASVGLSHVLSGQKSVTEALYETNLKNLYVAYNLIRYRDFHSNEYVMVLILFLSQIVMDMGMVSYESKSTYFYMMLFYLEVQMLRKGRKNEAQQIV